MSMRCGTKADIRTIDMRWALKPCMSLSKVEGFIGLKHSILLIYYL
jgi:hypothetical protein